MTEKEKEIIEDIETRNASESWRGWIPLAWSTKLLSEMKAKKIIGICNFNTILRTTFKAVNLYSIGR